MEKLNFNRFAKNEILSVLPEDACCCAAWLSAAIKGVGRLKISRSKTELIFESQDYDYIKSTAHAVRKLYHSELDIDVTSVNTGLQKGRLYTLKIPAGITDDLLKDTGIIYPDDDGYGFTDGIDNRIVFNECCAKNYLKSLFVAVGSAGVPEKLIGADDDIESSGSGYYLEFALSDESYASAVRKLLLNFEIAGKTIERGNKIVLYVKESETISNFFALLGANETVLYMQDIMVERMLNNNVNRKSNCEVANMDKTAIASTKQIIAIETIDRYYGIGRLAPELRELINLRLDNPTATLDFFAEKLGVSKSCVNHRFRKLVAMADELKKQNEANVFGEKNE